MRCWLPALVAALVSVAPAASVDEALAEARKDLDEALAELGKAREVIAAEKPELAREFAEVGLELREKRRLARIARMGQEDREAAMRELQRDLAVRERDAAYLAGLLKDHALKIQTVSGPGEPALALDPAMLAREADDPARALDERLAVVGASLDRLEQLFGGSAAPGQASSGSGEVVDGRFVAAGPQAWFRADDGSLSGAAVLEKGRQRPLVLDEVPAGLFEGETVMAGVDVTGGKARALREVGGGFDDLIRKGGLWVWPILLLAVLALVFGVIKLLRFSRFREPGEAWVNAILSALRAGERDKARSLAGEVAHPAGPVMADLIDRAANPAESVEETLYERLMGVQRQVGSMLPVIAVTAATAPLLGLLGTVSGMIRTFNLITVFGSGDPKPLAGGISEALVTTLFGLVVAIPALILHAFLARRSQGIVQTTEQLGLRFVNGLRDQ